MKRYGIFIAMLLVLGAAAFGQELVYYDGDVRVYERADGELFELQDSQAGLIDFGYQLDLNYVVKTFDGIAEIVLPNGHVLKLAENTEVQLEGVVAQGAASGNDVVSVAGGRLRSVVANLTGTGRGFQVRTPTAVGGVRGTDFVTQVSGSEEIIAVKEGLVNFTNNAGTSLSLGSNQFANAIAASFAAAQADVVSQFYGNLNELSEQAQQAQQQILAQAEEPEGEAEPEEEPEGAEEPQADVDSGDAVTVEPQQPAGQDDDDGAAPQPAGDSPVDQFMADFADVVGLEIGSISLEGQTYSKLVAQPVITLGELRLGLYLPVIYSGNLFDIDDWYKPKGNNEWSFGTDQDWRGAPFVAIGDLMGDLALKIKFAEWGDMRDDFFLKVGNLNTLQLGHGLLMRNYANDTDFPAIRRIGFNIGYDFGGFGFEALTNDLAAPQIFGARTYVRPIPNFALAVGLSGVADIAPASDLPGEDEGGNPIFADERTADPVFLNLALDLDLPIVESDFLSLILFGDVGGFLPYLRNGVGALDAGLQTQALSHEGPDGFELRNYGLATGVFGNVAMLDYRLEFQNYHGIFEPAFYDANYDRVRGEKVRETIAYLQNPGAPEYEHETLGIYGEAGFSLFDVIRLEAGYLWPWTRDPDTDEIVIGDNDFLKASLDIADGLLPLGITAGASYERTYFAPTLLDDAGFANASLFDE
ncbi:MAG: FecR family protein, partial [Spirochaetota bacterium]